MGGNFVLKNFQNIQSKITNITYLTIKVIYNEKIQSKKIHERRQTI